jgi:hypothetical protein
MLLQNKLECLSWPILTFAIKSGACQSGAPYLVPLHWQAPNLIGRYYASLISGTDGLAYFAVWSVTKQKRFCKVAKKVL